MFTKPFNSYVCDGDEISTDVGMLNVTARVVHDDHADPPWEMCDGHGPVSDWTSRDKRPGEVVLNRDHGSFRYYDWEEAIKIAKRDGWDAPPYGTGSKGQKAERAVKADFEYLQSWCRDEWHYVGIVLSVSKGDDTLDSHAASLWGIACNLPNRDNSYLLDLANELLDEAVEKGKESLEALVSRLTAKRVCEHCGEGLAVDQDACPECGQHA